VIVFKFTGKTTFELMHYIKNILTACFLMVSFTLLAQTQAKKVVADKIAAIVGDRIILQSDIKNSIADIIRQGGNVPDNAECLIMEQAIVSKVLMLQAEKDSIPVTDEEVEAQVLYQSARQPRSIGRNGRKKHLPDKRRCKGICKGAKTFWCYAAQDCR